MKTLILFFVLTNLAHAMPDLTGGARSISPEAWNRICTEAKSYSRYVDSTGAIDSRVNSVGLYESIKSKVTSNCEKGFSAVFGNPMQDVGSLIENECLKITGNPGKLTECRLKLNGYMEQVWSYSRGIIHGVQMNADNSKSNDCTDHVSSNGREIPRPDVSVPARNQGRQVSSEVSGQ